MTLVKSKYFMLKANFPQEALKVDNEPLIDNHEPEEKTFNFGDSKESSPDQNVQQTSMMDDPKHANRVSSQDSGEGTEEERKA